MLPHIFSLSLVLVLHIISTSISVSMVMGASTSETVITLGSSISTSSTQSWSSSSGRFAFGFYPVGEAFAIGVWFIAGASRIIVWTAHRDDPPISGGSIILGYGGALQLSRTPSTSGSQPNPISVSSNPATSAARLNTGNFVLYDMNEKVIWSTFDSPTDTLLPGQNMRPGWQLFSSASQNNHAKGKYYLVNQQDGNLVMYPVGTVDSDSSYWSAGTSNRGLLLTLSLDPNGTLWMFDRNASYSKTLFQTNQSLGASPDVENYYRLTLDADGVLRLYLHVLFGMGRKPTTKVQWQVPGSDRCLVKGVCGPNSFCQLTMTGETSCSCLPGFELLSTNQSTLGCWRTLPISGCAKNSNSSDEETRMMATMVEVKNTTWTPNPFAVLPATTSIEDCKALCLSDCACEISMFSDSYCSKQMTPVTYGRMSATNTTLFVKVYTYQGIPVSQKTKTAAGAGAMLISGAVLVVLSLVILSGSVLLISKHRRSVQYTRAPQLYECKIDGGSFGLRHYSFQDLDVATNGFTHELGRGAYGTVFKGVLVANINKDIAVKRLEKMAEDGEREFYREVRAIARTHHRNLLRLLGFCNENMHRLLVYEYMPNGSLANLLFNSDVSPSWSKRFAIALDVARGLQYLHEDIESPIIHCDIKPENILIDNLGIAKIADFGLAKLLIGNQTNTFTGIRGTRGYLAPEWSKNTAITVKVDVYSYGVMLLELISCKRSMELKRGGNEYNNISEWAYECVMFGGAKEVAGDVCIEEAELVRMLKVGIWCTQNMPVMRPAMKSVVMMMEGSKEVRQPPPPASFSQS